MITKLLTIPLLLASLIACTKQSPQGGSSQPENVLEIETQSIVLDSNDENDNEPILFRIDTKPGSKARKRLYVKNSTSETIVLADMSAQLEDPSFGAEFSLVRNVCRSTLGVGRSCYLDIQVSGDVSDKNGLLLFLVDGRNDELSDPFVLINVEADEEYAIEESSEDALIKSTEVINFGVVGEGKDSKKRIYFSNTNKVLEIDKVVLPALPTGVIVTSDSCPAKIQALSSCYIDFLYSHQLSGNLTLNETVILSSAKLAAKNLTFQGSSVVSADPNAVKLSISTINIPAKTVAGKEYVNRIYISNTSNSSLLINGSSIISGATVEKNTCSVNLKPGRYCYIDISNTPTVNNESFPPVTADIPEGNISNAIIREGSGSGEGEGEGGPSCSDLTDNESCPSSELGCYWDTGSGEGEEAVASCKPLSQQATCDQIDIESSCTGTEIGSGCRWMEVYVEEGSNGYCFPKMSAGTCSQLSGQSTACGNFDPGVGICVYNESVPFECIHSNSTSLSSAFASTNGIAGSALREPSFGATHETSSGNNLTLWTTISGGGDTIQIYWVGNLVSSTSYGSTAEAEAVTQITVGNYTYYREGLRVYEDAQSKEFRIYRIDNVRAEPVSSGGSGGGSPGGEEGGPPPGGEEG